MGFDIENVFGFDIVTCLKLTLLQIPIEVVLKVLWKVYGFIFS